MKVKVINERSPFYNRVLEMVALEYGGTVKHFSFYDVIHDNTHLFDVSECVNWEETTKFDEGKPDFTLIPQEALLELAKVFTHGAKKYGKHNYSLGTDYSRYIAAAHRHINQWLRGEDIDEIGTNHLANAAASLLMVLDNQKTNKGTDDRNKIYRRGV